MSNKDDLESAATAPALRHNMNSGGSVLSIVPQNLDEAVRLARGLSTAGTMVPEQFRNDEGATLAAILTGLDIGLKPTQALKSITVINGRSCVWGDALPALMQQAGHSLDVEILGDGDELRAVATLKRGDTGQIIVREFSVADAKAAGLFEKKGPWQQYLKRMLSMRARTWACRDGAADTLMGLQVAEEVRDYEPATPRDVTPREGGFAAIGTKARQEAAAPPTEEPKPAEEAAVGDTSAKEANSEDIPDAEIVAEFFTEGAKAALDGGKVEDCPYADGTEAQEQWLAGLASVDAPIKPTEE
jgi:hypothetical protein